MVPYQASHLLDTAFVDPLGLHHSKQQAHIQGHDRNRRRRLRDDGLVDRHPGSSANFSLQLGVQTVGSCLEILLGRADRAVLVNRPRHRRAVVAIGQRLRALRQQPAVGKSFDPPAPVLASHDRHGFVDLRLCGCLDRCCAHRSVAQIDGLSRKRRPDGLEARSVRDTCSGIRALGRCEAVDDQVHLAHRLFDYLRDLLLGLVGESVAVDAARPQPVALGSLMQGNAVVVAGACGAPPSRRLFEEHAQRVAPQAPAGRDARRQAVAGRRSQDQDIAQASRRPRRHAAPHMRDLPFHVPGAPRWMGVHANEAS